MGIPLASRPDDTSGMGTATIQLNVRVTPELRAAIAEQCRQDRATVNDFVTTAIRAHLAAAKEGKTG